MFADANGDAGSAGSTRHTPFVTNWNTGSSVQNAGMRGLGSQPARGSDVQRSSAARVSSPAPTAGRNQPPMGQEHNLLRPPPGIGEQAQKAADGMQWWAIFYRQEICCALVVLVIFFLVWASSTSTSTDHTQHTSYASSDWASDMPCDAPETSRASKIVPDRHDTDLPEDCMMSGSQYAASAVCSSEVRKEWSRLAAVPKQQNACQIDYNTGRMVCDTQISCEGGRSRFVEDVQTKRTLEYDCGKCHEMQRTSCCSTCRNLKSSATRGDLVINKTSIHDVTCYSCDHDSLQYMVPKTDVSCSHNEEDGHFKCSVNKHCELGDLNIDTQNLSFSCMVTPCDQCSDPTTKAQCCVTCLTHYCTSGLSFSDRKVCRGCNMKLYSNP
eukprot:TRINITY_DN105217_c0_g1_i1.p1 TRINITY_DN105217_c0_g1~~TRINITY_DN105217_c0_g1_i1.p1  ORF type:complete len:383 (+),score=41.52 TRINITY_DN105217_c0_g1_i1:67-1215(+)